SVARRLTAWLHSLLSCATKGRSRPTLRPRLCREFRAARMHSTWRWNQSRQPELGGEVREEVSKLLVAMLIVLAGAAVGWWSAGWGSGERSKRGGGLWQ